MSAADWMEIAIGVCSLAALGIAWMIEVRSRGVVHIEPLKRRRK